MEGAYPGVRLAARRPELTGHFLGAVGLFGLAVSLGSGWTGTGLATGLLGGLGLGLGLALIAYVRRRGPDFVLTDDTVWDRRWAAEPIALGDITFVAMSVSTEDDSDEAHVMALAQDVEEAKAPATLRLSVHPGAVRRLPGQWLDRALTRWARRPADLPPTVVEIHPLEGVDLYQLEATIEACRAQVPQREAPPPTPIEDPGAPDEVMVRIQRHQSRERWARVVATLGAAGCVATAIWLLGALEPGWETGGILSAILFPAALVWYASYHALAPKVR